MEINTSNTTPDQPTVSHAMDEETPLITKGRTSSTTQGVLAERKYIARQKKVFSAVTLADIFQKIVWTSILANLLLYCLTYLECKDTGAVCVFFIFSICSWVICSWVNLNIEHMMSRRTAITAGFAIYLIGVVTITGLSANMIHGKRILKVVIFVPWFFIILGEAICKTCLGDFGHEQFVEAKLSESLKVYSSALYWVGHIGALIMIAIILGTQQFANFEIGFGLCCVLLAIGFVSFCIGWNIFRKPHKKTSRHQFKLLMAIAGEARHVRNSFLIHGSSRYGYVFKTHY